MLRRNITIWAVLIIVIFSGIGLSKQKYSRRTPIVEAFEKSKNAVVSISSEHIAEVRSRFFDFWGRGYSPFRRHVVIPSLGSGFVISRKGYIVTNAHVVERASEITVIMFDKSRYKAQVIAIDSSVDLAILKIEADKPLPTIEFCYDEPIIGETVLAIGNPFGYQHTLTDGIVSAIHRDIEFGEEKVMTDLIQTSAPINPGSSGGPLLNINGELIAINTAIRKAAEGIGFAIPVSQLCESLPGMLDIEKLRRVDFGLMVSGIVHGKGRQSTNKGLVVESVRPGSAADRADFQVGDVIRAVQDKSVTSVVDFYLDILERQVGSMIKFDVLRKGRLVPIRLTLNERPKPDGKELSAQLFGLKVTPLTKRMIRDYNLFARPGDVVVTSVEDGGPADKSKIQSGDVVIAPGDVVVAVDNEVIQNIDHLGEKLEMVQPGRNIKITLNRTSGRGGFPEVLQYEVILTSREKTTGDNAI